MQLFIGTWEVGTVLISRTFTATFSPKNGLPQIPSQYMATSSSGCSNKHCTHSWEDTHHAMTLCIEKMSVAYHVAFYRNFGSWNYSHQQTIHCNILCKKEWHRWYRCIQKFRVVYILPLQGHSTPQWQFTRSLAVQLTQSRDHGMVTVTNCSTIMGATTPLLLHQSLHAGRYTHTT